MGLLDDNQNTKYRLITDLVKFDEPFDKKKNSLTGLETLELLHKRYLKLRDILEPLKQKIKNIEIIDVEFGVGMQEDSSISIRYIKDESQKLLSISNLGDDEVEVISCDKEVGNEVFIQNNKKIFVNIFKGIDEYGLDNKIELNTTSKKFIFSDLADNFIIKDNESKVFGIFTKHSLYEKEKQLVSRISCNYPKIKDILDNNENILNIYNHLHVYEEEIDKKLLKKLI